jgi:hypothetical protein
MRSVLNSAQHAPSWRTQTTSRRGQLQATKQQRSRNTGRAANACGEACHGCGRANKAAKLCWWRLLQAALAPQVTLYRATDGALCGFRGLGVVGRNGPTSSTTITGTDAEGSDCARGVSVVLYIVLYIALLHRVLLHIVILYCILHCFILYSVRGGAELRWALSYNYRHEHAT